MSNRGMRLVQNTDSQVYVATERPEETLVPVFNLAGAVYQSTSAPWFPPFPIQLTEWYVATGSTGTSTLTIAILFGDDLFNITGKYLAYIDLPADKRLVSGKVTLGNQVYNYPVVTREQWIKVAASGASGHSDLTVQIYGKKV